MLIFAVYIIFKLTISPIILRFSARYNDMAYATFKLIITPTSIYEVY